jgi:outer membrane receptor protein involved in Fe transport
MMMPKRSPYRMTRVALALGAAGMLAAVPIAAQQAPSTAPEEEGTQKVVITANKRPQKQREVAGTISVLQGSDLEQRGATSQEDALRLTPGVQLTKGETSFNDITIRGLGTGGCSVCGNLLQGTTGVYLQDVPLTDPIGKLAVPDIQLFDVERLEILRGPQGALYGSSSLGGALRYVLAQPNLKGFDASVLGGVSTVAHGSAGHSLYGMVNVPLSENVAAIRAVAFDRKDGGYLDNPGTGRKDANQARQRGGRVLGTVQPNKAFKATLTVMTQTSEQDDGFSIVPDPTTLEHNTPSASPRSQKFDFANLEMNYDLGQHVLTSMTGWWKKTRDQTWDNTPLFRSFGIPFPFTRVYAVQFGQATAKSQEFRIANKPGGALSYLFGFIEQHVDSSSTLRARGEGTPGPFLDSDQASHETAKERALFFDGEYDLGSGWSVGLGGRFFRTNSHLGGESGGVAVAALDSAERGSTPKASVKYRFGDNLWYASAAKGYRFGGRNAPPTNLPYSSDSVWNYETGLRLAPARGLLLDVSLFYLDWDKAQFSYLDTSGSLPTSVTGNVGKARSVGFEGSLQYRINSSFDLAAALAYTDAKTTRDVNGPSGLIATGSRLPNTPKLQTSVQANARFEGPLGSAGKLSVTHSHVGDRVLNIDGTAKFGGYDTVDLGLSLARDNYTVLVNLANATDSRGVMSHIPSVPGAVYSEVFIQKPRTLSVSLRYDF